MKKIILSISIILLLISIFFAYNKHFKYILPKEYKSEIEALLEKEIPKATQEIKELYQKIDNEKDEIDKDILIQTGINTILFDLYDSLINATKKYKNIDKEIPLTDFDVDLAIVIFPYLNKNKVDYTSLKQFLIYANKEQAKLEEAK